MQYHLPRTVGRHADRWDPAGPPAAVADQGGGDGESPPLGGSPWPCQPPAQLVLLKSWNLVWNQSSFQYHYLIFCSKHIDKRTHTTIQIFKYLRISCWTQIFVKLVFRYPSFIKARNSLQPCHSVFAAGLSQELSVQHTVLHRGPEWKQLLWKLSPCG